MVVAIYEGVRVGGPTRYPPPMAVNRPQPNSKPVWTPRYSVLVLGALARRLRVHRAERRLPRFTFRCAITALHACVSRRRVCASGSVLAAAWMASPSAGSARKAVAPPPVAARPLAGLGGYELDGGGLGGGLEGGRGIGAPVDSGATVDITQLCEKALTAAKKGRHALATASYGRAAAEALRLHGETFVCTFLTLRQSQQLHFQSDLEGVTADDAVVLRAEAWALLSSSMPLLVCRMDDNITMLPGRGTALELAFNKRRLQLTDIIFCSRPDTARELQLKGLSLGYATALEAASQALRCIVQFPGLSAHDEVHEVQAFILRVVDNMQPAARSLADCKLAGEVSIASYIQQALTDDFAGDPKFLASLHTKWTAAAIVQMRRARGLLDATDFSTRALELSKAEQRADVVKYGLKECALLSCGKLEASVRQHKRCSACRSAWYCSAEHAALHWKEHKPICRATTATQHAAAGEGAARD